MATTFKNYQRALKRLEFNFPGLNSLPRSPFTYHNLDIVDIYIGKRKLELLNRLPTFDAQLLRRKTSDFGLDKRFAIELLKGGYISVESEIKTLVQEERSLLENSEESGRTESFLENKALMGELVKGLVDCAEIDKADSPSESVRARKTLGEQLITLEDFWLARKMFTKCFDYLTYIDDETDMMRVELWCLISYICIYFEESQEIGFNLPTQCLVLARTLSQDKPWVMKKTVMNVLLPKAINIYGLRNDWLKIKSDWANIYNLATILLHVLSVKKALYWQQELTESVGKCRSVTCLQRDKSNLMMYENIEDALTRALTFADEVRQNPAFIATALRRGLFYEEYEDTEKAMLDFFAIETLCKNLGDKTTLAIVLNRVAYNRLMNAKPVDALDYFVQELEIATENDIPELAGDALQGLGSALLEEGHTWESDECFSQAYTLFSENREPDTPNDFDDISWAMLGVSRGHHLWSRYSGLIRTQERYNLKSVNDWKCNRRSLPLVLRSDKKCSIKRKSMFEKHYMNAEDEDEDKDDDEDDDEDAKPKRFYELTKEICSKRSIWFDTHGCENMFSYMDVKTPIARLNSATINEEVLKRLDLEREAIENRKASTIRRATSLALSWRRSTLGKRIGTVEKKLETFLDVAEAILADLQNVSSERDDASEDPEINPVRSSKKSVKMSGVEEKM